MPNPKKQGAAALPVDLVKISYLIHSHTNATDRDKVDELAESIKNVGLINPITVREQPGRHDHYEIVCGERRARAYELLGYTEIPAFIRVLTDEEALTIQITENLDREDISPIDEAVQFAQLMKSRDIEWLASKINRGVKYISDRLKLNDLIDEAKGYVRRGVIPLGHGIMISKLLPADQAKCVKECISRGDDSVISYTRQQLKNFIQWNLTLDMNRAPFDTADETLPSLAGSSCDKCALRTINSKMLFSDMIEDDRCTNRACYEAKQDAHIERAKKEAKEKFGKVAVGQKTWNNEVKVGGKLLKYSDKPGKNTTPVVINKVENNHSDFDKIGEFVHVVIPPKEAKKEVEKKTANESWVEKQNREYLNNTVPKIRKAAEYFEYANEFPKLLRERLYEQMDDISGDIVAPLLMLIDGEEIEPMKTDYPNKNISEIKRVLNGHPIGQVEKALLFATIIEDCESAITWEQVEQEATPPKSLKSILPTKKAPFKKK